MVEADIKVHVSRTRNLLTRFNNNLVPICTHLIWWIDDAVEPVLKDRPIGHKDMVSQGRWSLVTGSIALKSGTCQEYVVLQDRWSLVAGISQDRFHCIIGTVKLSFFSTSVPGLCSQWSRDRADCPRCLHIRPRPGSIHLLRPAEGIHAFLLVPGYIQDGSQANHYV